MEADQPHRRCGPTAGLLGHARLSPFCRRRQARVDDPLAEMPAHAKHLSNEHIHVEAGTARIDAPSAVDGDPAGFDEPPLGAGLIAVMERRIAAAEIGVALPQRRMRQPIGDGDGIDHHERVPKRLRFAERAIASA